jgi:hypothetical protein
MVNRTWMALQVTHLPFEAARQQQQHSCMTKKLHIAVVAAEFE